MHTFSRHFLGSISLAVAVSAANAAEIAYPHATLTEAFEAAGFDPKAEGAAHIVICADSHIRLPDIDEFPADVISDVNAMSPAPAFLLVNGDMITSASGSFGNVPNEAQKKKARAEFGILKRDMAKLNPGIGVKFTLGNHDTYPYEKDGELFRSVFPDHNVYDSFELAGVQLILLNGAQSGDIDPAQLAWLKGEVAAMPSDRTAVLFVHQPALGSTVNERGIGAAVREAFADYDGELWLVGGHGHHNGETAFKLPKTTIVQAAITTCNGKVWGGREHPGYWVYCLRNGQLAARIFRKFDAGYRVDPAPDRSRPRAMPEPFEDVPNIVWKIMVGDGDRQYLRHHKAADVVTWWAYTTELHYEFPLAACSSPPTHIAALASLYATDKKVEKRGKLLVSADGAAWEELPLPKASKGVYLCPLPDSCRGIPSLHVKILGPGYRGGVAVGGFAFCCPQPQNSPGKETQQ